MRVAPPTRPTRRSEFRIDFTISRFTGLWGRVFSFFFFGLVLVFFPLSHFLHSLHSLHSLPHRSLPLPFSSPFSSPSLKHHKRHKRHDTTDTNTNDTKQLLKNTHTHTHNQTRRRSLSSRNEGLPASAPAPRSQRSAVFFPGKRPTPTPTLTWTTTQTRARLGRMLRGWTTTTSSATTAMPRTLIGIGLALPSAVSAAWCPRSNVTAWFRDRDRKRWLVMVIRKAAAAVMYS